jgi:hypothetical protein
MADFGGGDPEAFRKEVREWVDANFPAELKSRPNPMMREERAELWSEAPPPRGAAAVVGGGLDPRDYPDADVWRLGSPRRLEGWLSWERGLWIALAGWLLSPLL